MADGTYMNVSPKDVKVGERIEVKPGGRVPLDGVLLEAEVQFDTSALTGKVCLVLSVRVRRCLPE